MGRSTRPLHDGGNHGTFERRSLRQAARRGRLTTRPDLPETWSGPALLHHAEGHDRRILNGDHPHTVLTQPDNLPLPLLYTVSRVAVQAFSGSRCPLFRSGL